MVISSSEGFRWSVLPPVPLLGIGTELVESAEHYAARLAWITGTSIGQLCSLPPPYEDPWPGKAGVANGFCGPGDVYKPRIRNLETLTGVGTIRCGTFMVLDQVLTRYGTGVASSMHRWCPQCYLEWDENTSWEPLIWRIELITTCPKHDCELVDTCHVCRSGQWLPATYQHRRRCHRCRASLGRRGQQTERHGYYRWAQWQLCDLVRMCATPGEPPVSALAIRTFVDGMPHIPLRSAEFPWGVSNALMRAKVHPRRQRASLETIVNLCGLQGVRMTDMLRDPVGAASKPLLDQQFVERSIELWPRRHRVMDMKPYTPIHSV